MPNHQSGFSLIELSVVLIIIGIIAAYAMNGTATYMVFNQQKTTVAKLAAIDQALILFASRNKRLPCPADGSLTDAAASAGHESLAATGNTTDCATGVAIQIVPWRDLGLTRDQAVDGWSHRIGYHVQVGAIGMTRPEGIDMSATRAAATDNTSPSSWLTGKGLTISDENGNQLLSPQDPAKGGGAAFVLVSYGRDGSGSYNSAGSRLPLPPAIEIAKLKNATVSDGFIAARFNDAKPGSENFFDDILDFPSVHMVAFSAGLGPQ